MKVGQRKDFFFHSFKFFLAIKKTATERGVLKKLASDLTTCSELDLKNSILVALVPLTAKHGLKKKK